MTTAWIPIWLFGAPLLSVGALSVIYSGVNFAFKIWIAIPNTR